MTRTSSPSSRVAKLTRWLTNLPDSVARVQLQVVEDGRAVPVQTWEGPPGTPSDLAAAIDQQIRDEADTRAKRTKGTVAAQDEAGDTVASQTVQADPDVTPEVQTAAEFDGSVQSILTQMQRHAEANKRLELADRAQLAEANGKSTEALLGVIETLSGRLERAEKRDEEKEMVIQAWRDAAQEVEEEGETDPQAAAMFNRLLPLVMARYLGPPKAASQVAPAAPDDDSAPEGE